MRKLTNGYFGLSGIFGRKAMLGVRKLSGVRHSRLLLIENTKTLLTMRCRGAL